MFKVELEDLQAIYKLLYPEKIYQIGEVLVDEAGIKDIHTRIKAGLVDYTLEGIIGLGINEIYVPFTKMKIFTMQTNIYQPKTISKAQLILEKNNNQYILEKSPLFDIRISTKKRRDTFKHFETVVKDYVKILTDFIEAYCYEKGFESPNIVYFLGRDLHDMTPRKENSGRNFLDIFNQTKEKNEEQTELKNKIEIVNPNVTFDQIGGCEQGKKEMMRIYQDIMHPERARFFGRDPEQKKGYLLIGESGCGKTLLVKALATKLKQDLNDRVKFYAINYEDITSIYRGGEAKATGYIFDLVTRNEKKGFKTLLFLDELHLVGSRSGRVSGVKDEALDTLIAHLGGMRNYPKLTVIGATYQPVESLDPAIVRRFGKWVKIEKPDAKERIEIFNIYIKQKQKTASFRNRNLFDDLDMQRLADATENFNGSHIEGIIDEVVDKKEDETKEIAGENATYKDLISLFTPITTKDFLEAIENFQRVERSKEIGFKTE